MGDGGLKTQQSGWLLATGEAFARAARLQVDYGLGQKNEPHLCCGATQICSNTASQPTDTKKPLITSGLSVGWDGWVRTIEMPESKSGALPLGYIPILR